MKYSRILITGGAGFVGSNLAINLKKKYPKKNILALDNLSRRGSELNLPRLNKSGIKFIHADIRNEQDLKLKNIDLVIECSAEASVMAGINSSPKLLLDTNLFGAVNCFELARKNKADVIFISSSRVYPVNLLNKLNISTLKTRFKLTKRQKVKGVSENGISEDLPLEGTRTLYGASKLCAELILHEYIKNYNLKATILRCGLLTGPWQMGKIDQGIISFWLISHIFKKPLSYFGFGGMGKQVRDFLHIHDLFDLIDLLLKNLKSFNNQVYNIGGGIKNSFSLLELTQFCQQITGNKIKIKKQEDDRAGDIKIYISNIKKIQQQTNWQPQINLDYTLKEMYGWITNFKEKLWFLKHQ